MRKKIFSLTLIFAILSTLSCNTALAYENRASKTLNNYLITMEAGNKSGELRISYDVRANSVADSVGVASIALYSSGGVYMTTILGSTDNDLIKADTNICKGTYSHTAVPGNSYYAIVTIFAEIGDDYDSRKVSTSIVTAPTVP